MNIQTSLAATLLCQTLLATPLLADGRSIIVLDASGSMWGQIDGRAKLEIAREALGSVLAGLDPATEIGLMAYGHREKGSCEDIELVVPPAAGTAQAITDAANAMKFLGKTPLSESVRRAASELKSTEEKATVILITDGIETCEADPCALGTELEASGVDFTAHVVGFGLTEEEGRAVACLAENTGGKYIQASDAGSLVEALKTTVVVAEPVPEPAPEPAPEPQPVALDKNFDPIFVLAEGQPEPADEIIDDAYVTLRLIAADGTLSEETITVYGRSTDLVPPGTYRMFTELNDA
jgi:Ca-activated chloride channel family protein